MSTPLFPLLLPKGFFSDTDRADHADSIRRIREQLLNLELQQFAFDLKDFLLKHREIDCFDLSCHVNSFLDIHEIEIRCQNLGLLQEGMPPVYPHRSDDFFNRFSQFLNDDCKKEALFDDLVLRDWSVSFKDLRHTSEEQLLPLVMQAVLEAEQFSLWESDYLKLQSPELPTTRVKSPHRSL